MTSERAGRRYDAALNILDRQVIDTDGRLVCKVDDLELERLPDGNVMVIAILTGPGAWGHRLPGWMGRLTLAVWRRLRAGGSGDVEPDRIAMSAISEIGSGITLTRTRDDLDVGGLERWVRHNIVEKIPGAGHAPE